MHIIIAKFRLMRVLCENTLEYLDKGTSEGETAAIIQDIFDMYEL